MCDNNQSTDILSKDIILSLTDNNRLVKEVQVFDTISSTNTYLKENADNTVDGTVVVASHQTNGRGRLGRSFYSPKDTGIYMSLFLTPDLGYEDINFITICSVLAVTRALKTVCGLDAKIKWVNDVFAGGFKICGILTEASFNQDIGKVKYVVAGIGININTLAFPDDVKSIASSVSEFTDTPFTRNELIAQFLNDFEDVYNTLLSGKKDILVNEYRKKLMMLGKNVTVITPGERYEATALDINENANLIVLLPDGTQKTLISGEISIRL